MLLPDILPIERRLIGMDLETTTNVPKRARIVELGLEIYEPGQPVREYRTLVNPGEPIPAESTAIHHITDAMVQGCRVCGEALRHEAHGAADGHDFKPWPFFDQLAPSLKTGLVLCDFAGYNLRFDLQVTAFEMKRAKVPWDYEGARVIDGFRLQQIAEPRSLDDAVERFLTDEEKADCAGASHSAMVDTKRSTRVAMGILRAFPTLPRDLQALHELCQPGYYDAEGKLRWENGAWRLSFGDHRGLPLAQVPRGYLTWMSGSKPDFSDKIKAMAHAAARGTFPDAPVAPAPPETEEETTE